MATVPPFVVQSARPVTEGAVNADSQRIKQVPRTEIQRKTLLGLLSERQLPWSLAQPPSFTDLQAHAEQLLVEKGLSRSYLGWTMVAVLSQFWKPAVIAVPVSARLLLLPPCECSAESASSESSQQRRGRRSSDCFLQECQRLAELAGVRVARVADSSAAAAAILAAPTGAVLGVANLDLLERSLSKLNALGVPSMAVPLGPGRCPNLIADLSAVREMLELPFSATAVEQATSNTIEGLGHDPLTNGRPGGYSTAGISGEPAQGAPQSGKSWATTSRNYLPLMRQASELFEPEALEQLIGQAALRGPAKAIGATAGTAGPRLDPITGTRTLAFDFLCQGGKHARPFITLAVYDALTGGKYSQPDQGQFEGESALGLNPTVLRIAMSIEVFHKASLVHDDIEDNDSHRYGQPTLHTVQGVPTAINVGDYLIGLGYRLVSREIPTLGALPVAEILDCLATAHVRLAEGQGAELLWRSANDKALSSEEALRIYSLKTAPAFEAALFAGLVLGWSGGEAATVNPEGAQADVGAHTLLSRAEVWERLEAFAHSLGVAFQILNDLKDWEENAQNKGLPGGDVLAGRPTVLWALALEQLPAAERAELFTLAEHARQTLVPTAADGIESVPEAEQLLQRVKALYQQADVFTRAKQLVVKHRQAALEAAGEQLPPLLRQLMHHLIRIVL